MIDEVVNPQPGTFTPPLDTSTSGRGVVFQRLCGKGCGKPGRIEAKFIIRKDFVTKCTAIQQPKLTRVQPIVNKLVSRRYHSWGGYCNAPYAAEILTIRFWDRRPVSNAGPQAMTASRSWARMA